MGTELTVRQKILVSAAGLSADAETFSVEDLIVKTWNLYPESFSLRGYHALHPDSNRVLAKLSGNDGLCGLGWLEHAESRMYRVTRKGRILAKQLAAMQAGLTSGAAVGVPTLVEAAAPATAAAPVAPPRAPVAPPAPVVAPPAAARPQSRTTTKATPAPRSAPVAAAPPPPVVQAQCALSAKDLYALQQVVKADALRKFLRGHALAFSDACAFWGFSSSSRPAVVQQRIDETADLLKRAVDSFGTEGPSDPRLPSLSTCYGLFNLHRLMLDKFAREVDALRLPMVAGG